MHKRSFSLVAALTLTGLSGNATPPIGVTSEAFRNPLTENVYATQWGPSPLFNFILQTSNDPWGYDLAQITNTFAAADATGKPSQSGWHDHPSPLGFVQITQGGLWVQEKPNLTCLTYFPTGSILMEGQGHIHNAFNFDQKGPTILRATWFIERNIPVTRTDQADQVTKDPNVASPPPTVLCPGSPVPPTGPGATGK